MKADTIQDVLTRFPDTKKSDWKRRGNWWIHRSASVGKDAVLCDNVDAGGVIRGGQLREGEFHGGTFYGGMFHGGTFHGGKFRGGFFKGGFFKGGFFRGGMFYGGTFRGGFFRGGTFSKGDFYGGIFEKGIFKGGLFHEGIYALPEAVFTSSPVLVLGLEYPVHLYEGTDKIQIGCTCLSVAEWDARMDEMGEQYCPDAESVMKMKRAYAFVRQFAEGV